MEIIAEQINRAVSQTSETEIQPFKDKSQDVPLVAIVRLLTRFLHQASRVSWTWQNVTGSDVLNFRPQNQNWNKTTESATTKTILEICMKATETNVETKRGNSVSNDPDQPGHSEEPEPNTAGPNGPVWKSVTVINSWRYSKRLLL